MTAAAGAAGTHTHLPYDALKWTDGVRVCVCVWTFYHFDRNVHISIYFAKTYKKK